MTDKIIGAALGAGWSEMQINMASPAEHERLTKFYAIAYRQGLEDAAKVTEEWKTDWAHCLDVADAIRALKEKAI